MRATVAGKFLQLGPERFWVKGVSYGTFAPDEDGRYFPPPARIAEDFALMRRAGVNMLRTYTVPDQRFLDLAQQHGLRIMAGVPWADHVAFLDDRQLSRAIRRDVVAHVRALASHPAVLMLALGNEIPAAVVRWLGPERVERFLSDLYADAKAIAPDTLFTYVNYPPTDTSIFRSSTCARSTSTCIASAISAPTWRACKTSPVTSLCWWPKPAPTARGKA